MSGLLFIVGIITLIWSLSKIEEDEYEDFDN